MSSSMQKQKIRPSWDAKKMQEAATKLVAHKIACQISLVEKCAEPQVEETQRLSASRKAEMLKQSGVNTPLSLVEHLAELEVNLFNADVSISGDNREATLFNENPTVWLEAKKIARITRAQDEKMQRHYKQWMEYLAREFGWHAKVEISPNGDTSKITFSAN
jgi:predicted RNA-binding protein Jag